MHPEAPLQLVVAFPHFCLHRYKDVRDEEARRQWVAYYVQIGNYAEARELGWEGDPDQEDAPEEPPDLNGGGTTGPIAITDDEERLSL